VIVDDFTGRLMPGRRWSDGLHQAVEAKENVKVESENVTYATITIQNYFRMYEKLSGMTGTAVTESEEFNEIYDLDPIAIPTNLDYVADLPDSYLETREGREPDSGFEYTYYVDSTNDEDQPVFWKRKDYSDLIFLSEEAKLRAIAEEIFKYHILGRPLLVGTTSVENSDQLSSRLDGPMIRSLAYVLMIRESWLRKNNRVADGRRIPDLQPLLVPLPELSVADLRRFAKDLELDLNLNIKSPENLELLLDILELPRDQVTRLEDVLKRGIKHNVLNARKHTEESQIIAGAGAFGAVTIATSMAGRGVDIKLGGELAEEILADVIRVLNRSGVEDPYDLSMEEMETMVRQLSPDEYGIYEAEIEYFLQHMVDQVRVKELGGLHVIGSERHEARRIDNQLRGRAARQGDPGSSRFYLSLEDELMVRFGGQQMEAMMTRLAVDESMPITNPLVDRVVEQSQSRVEGANFDVRKHLLEYDDVLNTQREKIYQQRERVFTKTDLRDDLFEMLEIEVSQRIDAALNEDGSAVLEDQAWRLLGWVESIQPTMNFQGGQYPSFTQQLILEELTPEGQVPSLEQLKPGLIDTAAKTLDAEEEYIQGAVERLWQEREFQFQDLVDGRMESLDMYLDGLRYADDENLEPRDFRTEIQELLRVRVELTSDDISKLNAGELDHVQDKLQDQIVSLLWDIEVRRLVGAVERVLGTELELEDIDSAGLEWEDLGEILQDRIQEIFKERRIQYLEDSEQSLILKSIDRAAQELNPAALDQDAMITLLAAMAEGRRAAFDKKSHKRIWLRTKRLNYLFYGAHLMENIPPEVLQERIIDHYQTAQTVMQEAWGRSELNRLSETYLGGLEEDLLELIQESIGVEELQSTTGLLISNLPEKTKTAVEKILGQSALTRIYRELFLRVISELWVEYLTEMEALRVSIGLEAYAQRDPLVQYKTKGFAMFQQLMEDMRYGVVNRMFTFRPRNLDRIQAGVAGD
jgi:preprotein translocase subunit SecA